MKVNQRHHGQDSVHHEKKKEQGAGQLLPLAVIATVVPVAHEGAVDAPAEEQLRRRLHRGEERNDAVVGASEVLDVDGQQEEVDDLDGDVPQTVDRHSLRELAQPGHRESQYRTRSYGTVNRASQRL
jgi:hypothetical protein